MAVVRSSSGGVAISEGDGLTESDVYECLVTFSTSSLPSHSVCKYGNQLSVDLPRFFTESGKISFSYPPGFYSLELINS